MVHALTSEERVSATLSQEKQEFLASVEKRWGPKTMVKDLGPDILNLDPNPENIDPWEDEDGSSFPELDNELRLPKQLGTSS